jgi:tetratricopeptide (TPR) repeat protein
MLPRAAVMRGSRRRPIRRFGGLALAVAVLLIGCSGADSRVRGTLQSGDSAARQRALREALSYYRAAVAAEPASFEAQTRRGVTAELLGEFDDALDAYARAARLQPSALAYYRAGALAERMGNTALAAEYLDASLGAAPTRSERMAQTGLRWVERLTASLDGSRLSRMLPDWVFRSLRVGRVLLTRAGLDRDVVAGELFTTLVEGGDTERALALARSRGWVEGGGADYCTGARGPVRAETRALVGMLVAPERTDCLLPVGHSLADQGLVSLARMVLLDRSRRSADPRVRRDAAALLRYRLPAHDVPKLAESLNIAGYNLQHRFGDKGGAAAAYQRAIATDPRFSWPYSNMGRLYMDMDQYELALDWLQRAVRLNPDHFRAQVNLGVTLYTLERYDEAVVAYRAALALNPADALVHADLGRSLLKVGLDGEGLRELQTAVGLDPSLTAERELVARRLSGDPRGASTPLASR